MTGWKGFVWGKAHVKDSGSDIRLMRRKNRKRHRMQGMRPYLYRRNPEMILIKLYRLLKNTEQSFCLYQPLMCMGKTDIILSAHWMLI